MTQIAFELGSCIVISNIGSTSHRKALLRSKHSQIMRWIRDKVSIQPSFRHFNNGSFRVESYDSDKPPIKAFENNVSCKSFVTFVEDTLIARLKSGPFRCWGKLVWLSLRLLFSPLRLSQQSQGYVMMRATKIYGCATCLSL